MKEIAKTVDSTVSAVTSAIYNMRRAGVDLPKRAPRRRKSMVDTVNEALARARKLKEEV